jgi:hypothetical protein
MLEGKPLTRKDLNKFKSLAQKDLLVNSFLKEINDVIMNMKPIIIEFMKLLLV